MGHEVESLLITAAGFISIDWRLLVRTLTSAGYQPVLSFRFRSVGSLAARGQFAMHR